jgi:spermidine/putrescine-binding protein
MTWTFEALAAQQENPAIQYVYPEEGAILWQDNWVMLKDAAHADAAYAWLNYTMQGDVFWLTLIDYTYINPNKAALEFAKANHPDLYGRYVDPSITNPPPGGGKWARNSRCRCGHSAYDDIWVEGKGAARLMF